MVTEEKLSQPSKPSSAVFPALEKMQETINSLKKPRVPSDTAFAQLRKFFHQLSRDIPDFLFSAAAIIKIETRTHLDFVILICVHSAL